MACELKNEIWGYFWLKYGVILQSARWFYMKMAFHLFPEVLLYYWISESYMHMRCSL